MERELMIQGARDRHEAQLNGLLNQPVITRVTTPQSPGNTALPSVQDLAQLTDQAMISRGILDDHRLQIASAQSRIELAEKDRYPDFSVGMGYAHRRGEDPLRGDRPDFVSVMFSMNLPLFTKQKQGKQLKQRHAEKQRSELLLDEAMRKVRSDIGQTAADYRAAKLQAELLNDTIIPQAEQTVASMLSGYQVNKVDFLNVVNGQLMLYNAQINYWQALGNAKAALARLAALAGKESLYE
jgi:outer membrane protein TolC